jgi:hypothetical protein
MIIYKETSCLLTQKIQPEYLGVNYFMSIFSLRKTSRTAAEKRPSTQKESLQADSLELTNKTDSCWDPEEEDWVDPGSNEKTTALAQQYESLIQDLHPSDSVIQQIDGILELAQYDTSLSNLLNHIDDSLIEKTKSPFPHKQQKR